MKYKNKLIFLSVLVGVLCLLYASSFIFAPERTYRRSSLYVWLDKKDKEAVTRIVINSKEQNIELNKKNGVWTAVSNNIEYPARKGRILDFIDIFSERGAWPVKAVNAQAHESFGLDNNSADRITFYGGASVILDILAGNDSAFGNEIALRKFGSNEVRFGDNKIKTYISNIASSWLNFKLFQDNEDEPIDVNNVQRLAVSYEGENQVFARSGNDWTLHVNGVLLNSDRTGIESYIRSVLNVTGDDFVISFNEETSLDAAKLVFELDNGSIITVDLSAPDETDARFAKVSGKQHIYSIPGWSARNLFRDASFFAAQ